jgi:hypothetical protein
MQLNSVVFPAPFGPISADIVPCSISKLQLLTARIPANDLVALFIFSID